MTDVQPGSPKKRRRSREEIISRITAAATDEFNKFGYSEATTSNIARKAGVTETQLFRYFGSKSALFRETVFDPLAKHLADFTDLFLPGTQLERNYTVDLQRFIREHKDLWTSLIVVEAYNRGDPEGVGEVDSLKRYFEQGEAALWKTSARDPAVAPRLMVRVSFAAVLACIMFEKWIFPSGLATKEEITAAISNFVMDGVHAVRQSRGAKDA